MPAFTPLEWMLLALAALAVGASKSGMPAFGPVPAALFATVLPARASTGAVLGLLLVGDLIAVRMYHAHADWTILRRLIPSVVAGVLLGVVVLWFADDAAVRRIIGATLILLVVLRVTFPLRERRSATEPRPVPSGLAYVFGPLGGFTTMIANAAGPVMTLYFVASRLPVPAILGTAAWFFLLVNAAPPLRVNVQGFERTDPFRGSSAEVPSIDGVPEGGVAGTTRKRNTHETKPEARRPLVGRRRPHRRGGVRHATRRTRRQHPGHHRREDGSPACA